LKTITGSSAPYSLESGAIMANKTFMKTQQILFAALFLFTLAFSAMAQNVTVVNAASYASNGGAGTTASSGIVTPEGLATAFGAFTITAGQSFYVATPGAALPKILGGVKVTINGADSELLFVGTGQINFVVPTTVTVGGIQTITVTNATGPVSTGLVRIETFAPGLFSVTADSRGIAAANWTITGAIPYPPIADFTGGAWVARDVSAGTKAAPSYLILYATGVRKRVAQGNVAVSIQGVPCTVAYAAAQGFFTGLDQLNVIIPPELAGLGIVNIRVDITENSVIRTSNTVTVKLGGTLPPLNIIKTLSLAGETVAGELTVDDSVEQDPVSKSLYFIDVYSFTTVQPNTSVAIDLRGDPTVAKPLDSTIILRKVAANGSQSFFSADDQGGGLDGSSLTPLEGNNNSLLVTVLPEASEYWVFVTSADVRPIGNVNGQDRGKYSLKFQTNVVTPLVYGQTISTGSISNATKIQTSAGVYVDAYSFTGTEADSVQIRMTSSTANFNPFLILKDRNGDELKNDDNSGGNLNAQIGTASAPYKLPVNTSIPVSRTFIILATPLANNFIGSYTLSLNKVAGFAASQPEFAPELLIPGRNAEDTDGRRANASRGVMYRKAVSRDVLLEMLRQQDQQ
jgi:uncharacterized protein (TIGR03437 family)